MSMTSREKAKHIDAFKYWCESNEENGVIIIPKFLCEHIVEILYDTNARPHGEWIIHRNKQGAHIYSVCSKCNVPHIDTDFPNFCENCGSDNRKRGDSDA